MLVATRAGPTSKVWGSRRSASSSTTKKGIAADEHRHRPFPIYATGDCAGYCSSPTPPSAGEFAAENAMGHDAVVDNRRVPRPIYTDPEMRASASPNRRRASSTAMTWSPAGSRGSPTGAR